MPDVTAQIKQGTLRGRLGGDGVGRGTPDDGIARFLGIPYGKPPFGELRFALPEPADGWDGVRDATVFGPTAPKPDAEHSTSQLDFLEDGIIPGEDCLNLNVWTPDPSATGLPVMFWIHGGAYMMGSSSMPLYDGSNFARDGVVFVSANYRLGVEGFSQLPDAPANRGVLDLLLALEWVRDNISAFGGDPGNVTCFGESGGAGLTLALIALDPGLFKRAAISSAALGASLDPADAALVTKQIALRAGVEPTAAALSGVDPQTLANYAKLAFLESGARPDPQKWGATTIAAGMPFTTVHDGELLTQRPLDLVLAGASRDVELLIGWTADEMLALVSGKGSGSDLEERARGFLGMFGAAEDAYDVYLARYETPGAVLGAAMRDAMFRIPALTIADSRDRAATFVYEFGWASPIPGLGAAHGLDLGFIFDNLGQSPIEGPEPSQQVASAYHRAFVDFAAKGNPGWESYNSKARPIYTFNVDSGVANDPRSDERELW
jgi:carboxylesterase type B